MAKRTETYDGFGSLSQESMSDYERTRLTKYGNQLKTNDQCIVISKLVISGQEIEQRKKVTECCAKVPNFGPLTDNNQADIYPGDALWVFPVGKNTLNDSSPVSFSERGKVFASFDGRKTFGAKTRDGFRKWLKFAGIAKGHHFYSMEQSNNGVAAIISGSTYVLNNSKADLPSFQKVKYVLPHPNESVRAEEEKLYAKNKRFPCKRTMPILVCANNLKQRDLISKTVIRIFRSRQTDSADPLVSIRRLHTTMRGSLTQVDYAAIALKRLLLQHSLHTVSVLERLGLISVNFPRAESVASYSSLDQVLSETLQQYITDKKRPNIDLAGPNANLNGFTSLTEDAEKEASGRLIWLALKTGLVHDSVKMEDSRFKESKNLSDALLLPTLSPYFSRKSNSKQFDIRRLLQSKSSVDEGVLYNDVEGMYSPSTYPKQLAKSQDASLEEAVEAFNMFKQQEDEQTAGMTMNHSASGEYTQILL